MSDATKSVMVKLAVEDAYSPPWIFLLDLIVSKVVEAPWSACGKNPLYMLAKTTSTKVLVAFKNLIACQFSKDVRLASTCPFQYRSRGASGVVVEGALWSTIESKSLRVAAGTPGTRGWAVEVAKMKNSPSEIFVASVPENEMVDPPKGDPVAETSPEVKVLDAYILIWRAKSTDSDVVLTKVVEAVVEPIFSFPMTAKVPAAGLVMAQAPLAAFANSAI